MNAPPTRADVSRKTRSSEPRMNSVWETPRGNTTRPFVHGLIVEDRRELRDGNPQRSRLDAHRQLVAEMAGDRPPHPRYLKVLAQHRRQLDIEIVERRDPIDKVLARNR